jgi:hypothetical protein
VLPALLHLGAEEWVRLVDLPETVQHLGQLRRVDRLHRDLHHRLGVEFQGSNIFEEKENLSDRGGGIAGSWDISLLGR